MPKYFQKGFDPRRNPGGRPPGLKNVEAVAREHTGLAMNTLAEICGDKENPPSARVTAASVLLDRGWGKPRQDMNHNVIVDPAEMSDAQLASIIASASRMVESDEDAPRH